MDKNSLNIEELKEVSGGVRNMKRERRPRTFVQKSSNECGSSPLSGLEGELFVGATVIVKENETLES